MASIVCHADLRADDVEQPGHDVDLDVERPERADRRERRLRGLARERDHDAVDVEHPHDVREPVGRPEKRHGRELGAHLARLAVDEPDDVDPVLRVQQRLARDELADVARAHDDHVLDVEHAAACEGARDARGRR